MKVVLTVAGTDPSGGAGIQADLQVIRDHGHHGVSVISAVLAQNTVGVREIYPMSADAVAAQLDTVMEDFDVSAVKVGLVPNDELVDIVVGRTRGLPVVWDPVMASGDGATTLFGGSTERLLDLLPHLTAFTPNAREASALVGSPIETREEAHTAARELSTAGAAVLLKVGHLSHGGELADIWAEDGRSRDLEPLPAIEHDVRGTGCQLSSAIACRLASGAAPRAASESARRYLNELLTGHTMFLGRGRAIVVR